jgi:hypothetical protein
MPARSRTSSSHANGGDDTITAGNGLAASQPTIDGGTGSGRIAGGDGNGRPFGGDGNG